MVHSDRHRIAGVDKNNTIEELQQLPGGEKFIDNNDHAGNSIVSRITRSLGSLKTCRAIPDAHRGAGGALATVL